MTKADLILNVADFETRVALVKDNKLQELKVERSQAENLIGNIYKGKVTRVIPGMQAAFVDVGLEKAGFLHVADILVPRNSSGVAGAELPQQNADIRAHVREGQEILVQVFKEPIGGKGARLTSNLSIAAHFLVYVPSLPHIGVSLRIEDEDVRNRLEDFMADLLGTDDPQSYIVRTVAADATKELLAFELKLLDKLWQTMQAAAKTTKAGLVYADFPLYKRVIRDMGNANIDKIFIDSSLAFTEVTNFVREFAPHLEAKLQSYTGKQPIFHHYKLERQIKAALGVRVGLKSGGHILIEQTESMITIDVNSGSFVKGKSIDAMIFKTNYEAVAVICTQLRLRNLGGIIIIDFIDMLKPQQQNDIYQYLLSCLLDDPARTNVSRISSLGLVQMTRKRTNESLSRILSSECAHCSGSGTVKSSITVAYEIIREIQNIIAIKPCSNILLRVPVGLSEYFAQEPELLANFSEQFEIVVELQVDPNLKQSQYDIVSS